MKTKDQVITREIYKTTNYEQFKLLKGNRVRRDTDIRAFAKVLEQENLMDIFPIEVNGDMFVIDGQKRLAAAQLINAPVYYTILPNATIDTVITRNTNTQSWSWLDFAQSWATRGNTHYEKFLELYEEFHYPFNILMRYSLSAGTKFDSQKSEQFHAFRKGEFVIKDYALTFRLLKQCQELFEESGLEKLTRDFANAAYSFMRTPSYNHDAMLKKTHQYGEGLKRCYTQADFLDEFTDIQRARDISYASA